MRTSLIESLEGYKYPRYDNYFYYLNKDRYNHNTHRYILTPHHYRKDIDNQWLSEQLAKFKSNVEKRLAIAKTAGNVQQNAFHFFLKGGRPHEMNYQGVAIVPTEGGAEFKATKNPLPHSGIENWDLSSTETSYLEAHEALLKKGLARDLSQTNKTAVDLPTMFKTILAPFENDEKENNENHDKELVAALTAKDQFNNAPIHYFYRDFPAGNTLNQIIPLLQTRIDKLSEKLKCKIALEKDHYGKNLFHYLLPLWAAHKVDEWIKTYGSDIARQALLAKGKDDEETYFHTACKLSEDNANQKILILCDLLNQKPDSLEYKQAQDSLNKAFETNKAGQNPFHLAANNTHLIPHPIVFQTMCAILPEDKRYEKITGLDSAGYNAIHYLIQKNNFAGLKAILDTFPSEKQRAIIDFKTKKGMSVLDLVYKHGNNDLLNYVLKFYKPKELSKLFHHHYDQIKQSIRDNSSALLSVENFESEVNKVYNLHQVYNYFCDKANRFIGITDEVTKRLIHFHEALKTRAAGNTLGKIEGIPDGEYVSLYKSLNFDEIPVPDVKAFLEFLKTEFETESKKEKKDVAILNVTAFLLTGKKFSPNSTTDIAAKLSGASQAGPTGSTPNLDVKSQPPAAAPKPVPTGIPAAAPAPATMPAPATSIPPAPVTAPTTAAPPNVTYVTTSRTGSIFFTSDFSKKPDKQPQPAVESNAHSENATLKLLRS